LEYGEQALMRLLYIWVKSYRNLHNVGIPFTGGIEFKEDYEDGALKRIYMSKNGTHISDFFGLDNLRSVTALIGQNGSGKTNIIELLRSIMPKGDRIISQDVVLILGKELQKEEIVVYRADKLRVDVTFEGSPVRIIPYPTNVPNVLPRIDHEGDCEVIHYSNTLSFVAPDEVQGVVDITTAGLLKTDSEPLKLIENISRSPIDTHIAAELARNVSFIFAAKKPTARPSIGFELPNQLVISPVVPTSEALRNQLSTVSTSQSAFDFIESIQRPTNDKKARFIHGVVLSFMFSWIRQRTLMNWEAFFESYSTSMANLETDDRLYSSSFEMAGKKAFLQMRMRQFHDAVLLLRNIEDGFKREIFSILLDPLRAVVSTDKPRAKALLRKIVKSHVQSSIALPFLEFRWTNVAPGEQLDRRLSAGEQAQLNFFSRLYDATEGLPRRNADRNYNVLLLIDEGDTFYHPEWQRQFFSDILNAIRWFFRGRKVQVVIATNGPFIVSDLPHWCVVYLNRDRNGFTEVQIPRGGEDRTFAQNIHTLLARSFFMSSTVGDFAETKISQMLKELNSGKGDGDRIAREINLIGEPIVRQRLLELCLSKSSVDVQIRSLKAEIESLEKGKR
jgi:hypothetical protein